MNEAAVLLIVMNNTDEDREAILQPDLTTLGVSAQQDGALADAWAAASFTTVAARCG